MIKSNEKKPVIATILYKPIQSTYERLNTLIAEGYCVYVFDNTPNQCLNFMLGEHKNNIRYFTFDKNVGIGPALRIMCATAYYEGNEHLLFFDQDTVFTLTTMDFISGYVKENHNPPDFFHREKILSVTFRDAVINRKDKKRKIISIGKYELYKVDLTISSGTLFSLANLKYVGWHDESYFIDGVDYYICLSAEAAGFNVAEVYNTPGLDHESDQGNKSYRFMFNTFSGRKYPAYRIKDYIKSSAKLILKATLMGSKTTFKISKMLLIYLMTQALVLVSKEKQA